MAKYQIALYLRDKDYAELITFARKIYNGFVASTVFTSPVPPLAEQLADVDLLEERNALWGPRGNRGSKLTNALLIDSRNKVRENLKRSARYCQAFAPEDIEAVLAVGFGLKGKWSKNSILEAVQGLRQIMHPTIQLNHIKTVWHRPANAPVSTIITYKIFRSKDEDINNAEQIAVVRRCSYTDKDVPSPGRWYYWVIPVNTHGDGVLSAFCTGVAFW